MQLWYRVSDLEAARDFYTRHLGFKEVYFDEHDRWVRLARNDFELAIAEGATMVRIGSLIFGGKIQDHEIDDEG